MGNYVVLSNVSRGDYSSVYTHAVSHQRFHDFKTALKSMRFGIVYKEPFLPENPSRDSIRERCSAC